MRRSPLPVLCFLLSAVCASAQTPRPQSTSLAPPVEPAVVAVVPVIISSPGANGTSYHTAVQAYNPTAVAVTGDFLFRDQTNGSTVETTMPFSINPGQTLSFPDLLVAMGRSGLGSLDIVGSTGTEGPVLSVRVYNDAGAAGTTGFTEDARRPGDALIAGQSAALVAPLDDAAYRFNVGVRTFDAGGALQATLRDQAGNIRKTVSRIFPANSFVQTDAAAFLEGIAPGPSDTITFEVTAGSLMVYGATADNQTGDPAIAVGQRIF